MIFHDFSLMIQKYDLPLLDNITLKIQEKHVQNPKH